METVTNADRGQATGDVVEAPEKENNAPSKDETLYVVRAGAFKEKANADKRVSDLKNAGNEISFLHFLYRRKLLKTGLAGYVVQVQANASTCRFFVP